MNDLIDILHEEHHSLVVANGDVCTFDGRGISDLYNLLSEDPEFLRGASVADKVVGKGAAALMIWAVSWKSMQILLVVLHSGFCKIKDCVYILGVK